MTPSDLEPWDRAAELRAVEDAYARYEATGRARIWDERNRGYARLAAELRERLLQTVHASFVANPTRILDLGCGSGELAVELANLDGNTELVGVDLRRDAIEEARAAFPSATWVQAPADALPMPNESLDVVVARLLFSSLPSARMEQEVAAEIARVLRPGGWLCWLDLRYSNPANRAVHAVRQERIRELFPGWRTELETVGLVPPVARRLGMSAGVLYPLLSRVPPLRSHVVGRLQRPRAANG